MLMAQCRFPGFQRFGLVGRAEHQQVRNGAQARQMFNRLMCRAILAQTNRIMRHGMNDMRAHQRTEADGGAGIIREHKEGRARRN